MSLLSELDRERLRQVRISRAVKDLFLGLVPRRWLWRVLLLNDDGQMLRRPAEILLAELREWSRLPGNRHELSAFDADPLVMARRLGRQEAVMRIIRYLNLDETDVQQLVEIDDGIG